MSKKKPRQAKCPTCGKMFQQRNSTHEYCHEYCTKNKAVENHHLKGIEQISDEMHALLKVAAGEVRGTTPSEIEAAQAIVTPALYEVAERIRLARKDRPGAKGGQFHLQYSRVGRTAIPVRFMEYIHGGHFNDPFVGRGGSEEDWE